MYISIEMIISSTMPGLHKKKSKIPVTKATAIILFTAGKESLLTLALCLELGIKPIPVYIDEDPKSSESKHKQKLLDVIEKEYGIKTYTIINEPGKLRYCDLGEPDNNWGAGTQFLSFVLEVLPFVDHFDADYILFGNEYSCDDYTYDEDEGSYIEINP